MSVFIRRFLADPGNEVFLEIEAINILDLDPPASISGIGTGTVICCGEYENGPFATGGNFANAAGGVLEVTGVTDFTNTFGELGYRYAGVPGNNPSARARKSDGALVDEYWNGNAFVQLNGKKFKRLLCLRVDTSVGYVEFRRQASVTGLAAFTYNLEPSQVLALEIGAAPASATFTATAATVTSGSGTYVTGFVGGETLTLGYDTAANFVVTFLAADQTKAQVIARINAYAGFALASDGGGALIILTGIQRGTGAQVRVVSGSAGVLTALGLVAAVTSGTGNVANIDAVTFAEVRTVVQAAVAGTTVEQDSAGRLRVSKNYVAVGDFIAVGAATTALNLGFTPGQMNSNDGYARLRAGSETFPSTFAGGETLTLGVDNEPDVIITFVVGDSTQAQVLAKINATMGYTMATSISGTSTLFSGRANGGQVRVVAGTTLALTCLNLTAGTVITAAGQSDGTIAAGTLLQNAAADRQFVVMQDVNVTAVALSGVTYSGVGPYAVKVRHALDDGSGLSATAGTITTIATVPDLASFQCLNPSTLTAALTESAIDAQYTAAIDTTLDLSTEARTANVIYAARQSNAIRRKLRENVVTASAQGMFGRMAAIRTPLGTTRAAAESTVAEPGVGAYRNQRVVYCYPQARTFVPIIARRGLAGGKGFTADGLVDVGADGFMSSILSQLPPEENPGQLTPFTTGIVSLESSSRVQGLTIGDYTNFRAKGIAALRIDDGQAFFQSGVTSVDPGVDSPLRNIARRRMADFIQDTLSRRLKSFGKKLSTVARRKAITSEIRAFMSGLLSANNPAFQRIDSFSIDDKSGNTPDTLAQGIYRIILKVRTLASLDAIVLETTIGESVTVDVLPQAA